MKVGDRLYCHSSCHVENVYGKIVSNFSIGQSYEIISIDINYNRS